MKKSAFIFHAFLLFWPTLAISSGLDTTFNPPHGYALVQTPFHNDSSGFAVVTTPKKKLLVAGQIDVSGKKCALIVRYLANGKIDPSFGKDGMVNFCQGERTSFFDLAMTSDGHIVAVGAVGNGSFKTNDITSDLLVAMLTPDGEPAPFFGNNGLVRIPQNEIGLSVVLQTDGKILVGGWTYAHDNHDLLLRRFSKNGNIDRSFGDNGHFRFDRGGDDYGAKVAVAPDSSILIVGRSDNTANTDAIVINIKSNGRPNPTFGDAGIMVFDHGADERLEDVAILPDNRIMAIGSQASGRWSDIVLMRLTPDGRSDPGFGHQGYLVFGSSSKSEMGIALDIDGDGCLYIAGEVSAENWQEGLVVKFSPDGGLIDRWVVTDMAHMPLSASKRFALATDIMIQHDGRPVVCGWAKCSGDTMDQLSFNATDDERFALYILRLTPY